MFFLVGLLHSALRVVTVAVLHSILQVATQVVGVFLGTMLIITTWAVVAPWVRWGLIVWGLLLIAYLISVLRGHGEKGRDSDVTL